MSTRTAHLDLRGKVVAITGAPAGSGWPLPTHSHSEVPWSRSATSMQQALVSPPRASAGVPRARPMMAANAVEEARHQHRYAGRE
jgi:hypothetical protein